MNKTPKLSDHLAQWNNTFKDYPNTTLVDLIESQINRTPDRVAVVYDDTTISYSALNDESNRLADYLINRGVTPDNLVGVFMERSIEMVVALLGTIKAGAAYVPLDPDYPDERLSFMVEDSAVSILLTQRRFAERLGDIKGEALFLDSKEWKEQETIPQNQVKQLQSNNLVYMIYTSGSTGRPKGVPNEHRGLVNRLLWMQDAFKLTENDRVLQKTPYSFDVSVWEFFWPLLTGASIVMAKPGGHKDNDYLVETICEHQISTLHFVPSMLNLFLEAEGLSQVSSLRQVICSGEALPANLVHRFFDAFPNVRLHNLYGPTEAAIDVTHYECLPTDDSASIPIGKPIANIQTVILDENLASVPVGETGELYLGGVGLARGYWRQEELTSKRFIKNPFANILSKRLYKTGDLARYRPDGNIDYLGRVDFQIKIRGFRVELQEIEQSLQAYPAVTQAIVVATDDDLDEKQLWAYLVVENSEQRPSEEELRTHVSKRLPDYMVPVRFVVLDKMPLLSNGKVDRNRLPRLKTRPHLTVEFIPPKTDLEKQICEMWCELLHFDRIGTHDNFFDLGGNSLLAIRFANQLSKSLVEKFPVVKLFQYPTVMKTAEYLESITKGAISSDAEGLNQDAEDNAFVAVIGMACRFPGAKNIAEFWEILKNGKETIQHFSKQDLLPHEYDPSVLDESNYVRAKGLLDDVEFFDAPFFGYMPREAANTDPQQRVWLETAWEALEQSGYSYEDYNGLVGVFAGHLGSTYLLNNLLRNRADIESYVRLRYATDFNTMLANSGAFLATRTAYKLNLKGPAINVETACSTSLVAIVMAVQSLLQYESDICIAGGVTVTLPQMSGYFYNEGGIVSKDGHCRPFDVDSSGTVFGSGAGAVVLKRLDEALRDNDPIWAIIRGAAINNDGADKVGFAAPSVDGQADAIRMAHQIAEVEPDSISYVETHGTATPLGDPIEISGLTKAFGDCDGKRRFCGLGSVKSNLGHLDAAAGVASFIKTVLSLKNKRLVPTVHFKEANPHLGLDESPFYVVDRLSDWDASSNPRRAGVSSFGVGGTNAHVVLEEALEPEKSGSSRAFQLIRLSAKTDASLKQIKANFVDFFQDNTGVSMSDTAWMLHNRRRSFSKRLFAVSDNSAMSAASVLDAAADKFKGLGDIPSQNVSLVFAFPGQGSLYYGIGEQLSKAEPVFKNALYLCCEYANRLTNVDIASLFSTRISKSDFDERLRDNGVAQMAIFSLDYAVAQLWMSLGVVPNALLGHSLGEWPAACISGILSLENAIEAVWHRGRLMQSTAGNGGAMAVFTDRETLKPYLEDDVVLAAENAPSISLVSGPKTAIDACKKRLENSGIACRMLDITVAVHSPALDGVIAPFEKILKQFQFSKPSVPIVSTSTGKRLSDEEAVDPSFWAMQMRKTVQFSSALSTLRETDSQVVLEVGAGAMLSALTKSQPISEKKLYPVSSLGKESDVHEQKRFLRAIGQLWLLGIDIDKNAYWREEERRVIPLPTYAFDRKRYWIESPSTSDQSDSTQQKGTKLEGNESDSLLDEGYRDTTKDPVKGIVLKILEEISGTRLEADLDEELTFFELGFDSLFLTQITYALKKQCDIELTMRQLLEEYDNIRSLLDYIKEKRPELNVPKANAINEGEKNTGETKENKGDTSLYFGNKDSLFGFCRLPPAEKRRSTGVLFCYPLGQEYIRSHWAFRLLSNYLVNEGYPVFKFDYYGTGDSKGENEDWNIERWVDDTIEAVDKMRELSGVQTISLVALRFGALIAAEAIEKGMAVDKCILWDPIFKGKGYIQELKMLHRSYVEEFKSRFPYPTEDEMGVHPHELVGFLYSPSLRTEMNRLSLDDYRFENCRELYVIASKASQENGRFHKSLRDRYHIIGDAGHWDEPAYREIALLPSKILEEIVTMIKGESN